MTRNTALVTIFRMWITRAISRANVTYNASHRNTNDFTYFDNASYSASQRKPTLTCNASHRISKDFTYFDNASHSANKRLLLTRATEFLKILHILITRAIPRTNAYL